MKTIDILNKKFSILRTKDGYTYHQCVFDYTQTTMTLKQIIELGQLWHENIDKLRLLEYHSDEQTEYKKEFPCWITGGVVPMMKTEDKDIIQYSNILAIDIDKSDNPDLDIDGLKQKLFELPYVFMVSKSISGAGIYVLILLENGQYTKDYYKYIVNLWKMKFNIIIDPKCSNIARKRFISYDDKMLIKGDDVDIKPWKLKYIEDYKIETKLIKMIDYNPHSNSGNEDLTRKAIWYLINNGYSIDDINTDNAYSVWYHVGCDFRHFTDGKEMFIRFSTNTIKYKDSVENIIKKWNNTKIEANVNDICRKWCGICKNKYGKNWISIIKEKRLF